MCAWMSDARKHIEVYNRYTGAIESERIYGEKWLRWTYESPAGKLMLHAVVKRAWFSRWYGWRMSRPSSAALVEPFVSTYGLDPAEFAEPVDSFRSFNDFFSRALRNGARPIDPDPAAVTFPADGRHLGLAVVGTQDRIYAKGQRLDLASLLGDGELAQAFSGGALVISRLCPVDYHRFHFACAGRASGARLVSGSLFSVSPIALRGRIDYLTQNKRMVTLVDTGAHGRVAIVEIGATCVGTIVQTFPPGAVAKGDQKGWFRFGGSCVITIFEPGRVHLTEDLLANGAESREVYGHMGDRMGVFQTV
jgi:phosphatidylserine decarboxylase